MTTHRITEAPIVRAEPNGCCCASHGSMPQHVALPAEEAKRVPARAADDLAASTQPPARGCGCG